MVPCIAPKRNLHNLLLYWVHGCYKVLDAKLGSSGTGERGGEEGTDVGQVKRWQDRDR